MDTTEKRRMQIEATRSVRPKDFQRKTLVAKINQDDHDRFCESAASVVKTGTFTDIHTKMQLEDFERHHYRTQKQLWEMEQEDRRREEAERATLRQTLLTQHKVLMNENTRKMDEMTEKWKKTQLVKKNRQIRDLQYELAVSRRGELLQLQQKQIHEKQEKDGVVEFERNMKKLGIAPNGNDSGMTISYEAPEAYEDRIKQLAAQTMPTEEEISNFKTQLKERTTANRLARYEKARRRRRALNKPEPGGENTEDEGEI